MLSLQNFVKLGYTEIITEITMYVVVFTDIYIYCMYVLLEDYNTHGNSIIIHVWSSFTKFCSDFYYNIFSVYFSSN